MHTCMYAHISTHVWKWSEMHTTHVLNCVMQRKWTSQVHYVSLILQSITNGKASNEERLMFLMSSPAMKSTAKSDEQNRETDWEIIFLPLINYMVVSQIREQRQNSLRQKPHLLHQKLGEEMNRNFLKKDTQRAKRYIHRANANPNNSASGTRRKEQHPQGRWGLGKRGAHSVLVGMPIAFPVWEKSTGTSPKSRNRTSTGSSNSTSRQRP